MSSHRSAKIGVTTATIIGMNAMIGSGIFTAPAAMASYVGPAGIVAYLFVVFSVWLMALSLARLAELFPEEGSFYTYTKQWAGHTGGMIASGLYMIGNLVAMGLLAQVAGGYLTPFFPNISATTLGVVTLGLLVILNLFGVVLSQLGQHILIACTLFPLLTTIAICLFNANFSNLTPFAPYGFGNVLNATRIVIFGFFGFECAASLFNVVENPQKNVPRALTYSILIVGLIYTLFITSLILSTPLGLFTDPNIPLSTTLGAVFPNNKWLLSLVHLSILSAIIGTIHSMIWSSSALLLSLAKIANNKIKMYAEHASEQAQRIAVLCVGSAIFSTFWTIADLDTFFNITAVCIVAAFILSLITLLTIKQEWKNKRNIITMLGICTALAIFYFAAEGLIQPLITS